MSLNSFIAIQEDANIYRSIYCHYDEFVRTGALLVNYYNTPEKVKELINLGGISYLGKKINPDSSKPHTFRDSQTDVTLAYERDMGDKNNRAMLTSFDKLLEMAGTSSFVYIYTMDNEWVYTPTVHQRILHSVKNDLDTLFQEYGLEEMPSDFDGNVTEEFIKSLEESQTPTMDMG